MARFKVLLQRDEDGFWVVTVPALPGCVSQGVTRQEALANIREAIGLHLAGAAADDATRGEEPGVEEVEVVVDVA
jgi:predicted RNase H-like HicB family nuclease